MNDLTLGIVLGLGIPYIIVMGIVLRRCFCPKACSCCCRDLDSESIVRMELSPEAYNDFMKGLMTSKLRNEITHLYALKGDLHAYLQIANRHKHTYMMEFLKDPTRHPVVLNNILQSKATAPSLSIDTTDNNNNVIGVSV